MDSVTKAPQSPFYIFIKGLQDKSAIEILELLGLGACDLVVGMVEDLHDDACIYIYNDKNWIHLMDNWFYSNWHSTSLHDRINVLGQTLEIFTCSVGDTDLSFNFKYYKDGVKRREYIVTSPNDNDEIISLNFGQPLAGEKEGLKQEDQLKRVTYIAKSLGIKFPKTMYDLRCYQLRTKI